MNESQVPTKQSSLSMLSLYPKPENIYKNYKFKRHCNQLTIRQLHANNIHNYEYYSFDLFDNSYSFNEDAWQYHNINILVIKFQLKGSQCQLHLQVMELPHLKTQDMSFLLSQNIMKTNYNKWNKQENLRMLKKLRLQNQVILEKQQYVNIQSVLAQNMNNSRKQRLQHGSSIDYLTSYANINPGDDNYSIAKTTQGNSKHKRSTSVIKTISTMKKSEQSNRKLYLYKATGLESEHTEILDDTAPEGLIAGEKRKAYEIIQMNKQLMTNPNIDTDSHGEPAALIMGGRATIVSPKNQLMKRDLLFKKSNTQQDSEESTGTTLNLKITDGDGAFASLKDKVPGLLEKKAFMQGCTASDEIQIAIKEEQEEDEEKPPEFKQGYYRFEDEHKISHEDVIQEQMNEDNSIDEGPPTLDEESSEIILFIEYKYCTVCNIEQPLRCKHCRQCNHCVATYDHHCPWVGNCVGENNRFSFYIYLHFQQIVLIWTFIWVSLIYVSLFKVILIHLGQVNLCQAIG